MSETGMLFDQEQDSVVWNGLGTFSRLPDWLVAARDPDRICDRLSHLVPEFNQGAAPPAKMRCWPYPLQGRSLDRSLSPDNIPSGREYPADSDPGRGDLPAGCDSPGRTAGRRRVWNGRAGMPSFLISI